jgi:glucose/arabinose dehydrogenase
MTSADARRRIARAWPTRRQPEETTVSLPRPLRLTHSLPVVAAVTALAACTSAPQQAPAPAAPAAAAPAAAPPPPAWAQGRPASMANSPLAPHAAVMTVTPPEKIPVERIKVPAGFKVELWAHGAPGVRMMARGDQGTVFAGTRGIGRVYAITDAGGKREVKVLASGLVQPNGVAFRNGALYVGAINRVLRFDNVEKSLDAYVGKTAQPVDLTAAFSLPPDQHHGWKFFAVGPDNKLYIPIGAPCNICEPPAANAQIRRYNLDGSGMEVVARGVRNSVGFDFHPKTGELWFTDNGRDWAGEDGFDDELNRVGRVGQNFGFPYCHAQGQADPDVKKSNACDGVTPPVALLGPHVAALGMRFYTGSMFPAEYRDSVLVARRGSWNRTQKSGYDVVRVNANPDGSNARTTPFITGFLDPATNNFWGRPVDVMQMPDGALLVADEQVGAIYRVSYGR